MNTLGKKATGKTARKSLDVIIGQNVRAIRNMRGLTQTQLAEALEITFQQVQKYERATNRISASSLINIARALDVEITQLLPDEPASIILKNPALSRQTAQLLQGFESINDQRLRRSIIQLVKNLAQQKVHDLETTMD